MSERLDDSAGLLLAGFVVVGPTPLPPNLDPTLPDPFLTISHCLTDELHVPEWYAWFLDRAEAQEVRLSLSSRDTLEVLAVAMTPSNARWLMDAVAEETALILKGGGSDQFVLLRRETPLPTEAELLGYEIVGAEWNLDLHSWHCHGYAAEAVVDLGIGVNTFGLLDRHEDAIRVLRWMLDKPSEEQPLEVPWSVVALARLGTASAAPPE